MRVSVATTASHSSFGQDMGAAPFLRHESTEKKAVVLRLVDLSKRYGTTVAVNGLNFEIGEGEIFGLLGPNGAGKTTNA
jgi:ABC-type uncharacterized transport system ATPase subunit